VNRRLAVTGGSGVGGVVLIDAGHFVWEEASADYASSILDSI
jgi:hypothetical protein